MGRIEPVVANRRERARHRRDAMRECRRTECRLADGPSVHLQPDIPGDRPVVRRRELHEQIVRMLTIVDGLSLANLAARQHIGVPAPANRPRLEADHSPKAEMSGAETSISHPHEPVDAPALVAAALTTQSPPASGDPAQQHDMQHMHMGEDQDIAMSPAREGSGTSWLRDETPMYAVHSQAGKWTLMAHGKERRQWC